MGKTNTAVISGLPEDAKSGKASYEEKMKKKAAAKEAAEKKTQGETSSEPTSETSKKDDFGRQPKGRGKNYKQARGKIKDGTLYSLGDAIALVKEVNIAKFDASVEFHALLKKDKVSVNVSLPYSAGKKRKIEIADDSTIEKLKAGKVDFDVLLATPDFMGKLVPFAKLLGPRGMMPNPKNGTLIKSKEDAKSFDSDSVTVKTEKKAPVIHLVVGKISQKDSEIMKNIETVIEAVGKNSFISASICSSMSPSVKLTV